ncbi:uncharacterized protein LOC130769080 [Actinidia eriantha]|uniref:uncharacterized protein LOC130769080 n=1 Tax=Actinidia eriantha TaxID=165200 RepID=UPI00258BC810|nr:uncharacterized protein LOC130769080 [Actinidia eriantha]
MVTQKSKNKNFVADGVVFAEPNEVWIRELAEDDVCVVKEKNYITNWGSDNEDDEMVYGLEDFDTEIYDEEEHIDELYGHEEHDGDDTEDRLEDLNMENEEIDVNNIEKPFVDLGRLATLRLN